MPAKPLHRGPTRVSVGCDGGSFSSPKERCKAALFWGGSVYFIASEEMRFSESLLAISALSFTSGRNTTR